MEIRNNIMGFYIFYTLFFLSSCMVIFLYDSSPALSKDKIWRAAPVVFSILVLGFFLIALRPFDAGGDTKYYLEAYSRINSIETSINDASYSNEILFWPLQAVFKLWLNERWWFIANYSIIIFLSFFSYKRITKNTNLSSLIFVFVFCTYFGVYAGNAMRQVYAVPLFIIAMSYLSEGRNFRFFLFLFFSISFHWSSLIFLSAYFFAKLNKNKLSYVVLPVCSIFISFMIVPIANFFVFPLDISWINYKLDLYLNGQRDSHIGSIYETLNFWLCIMAYSLYVITGVYKDVSVRVVSDTILILICLILFFGKFSDLSERYMVYFIFLIPIILYKIIFKIKSPILIKNTVFFLCMLIMSILTYTSNSARVTLGI